MPKAFRYSDEQIAAIVHEALRGLQLVQGDPLPAPPWEVAPAVMREWALDGVIRARMGATPRTMHEGWLAWMTDRGWEWGVKKDIGARKHPSLVPWEDLPREQRHKNELALLIIAWAASAA